MDGTPVVAASGDGDGIVRVWRLEDGTPVGEPLRAYTRHVAGLAAGHLDDGTPVIISGGDDCTIRVWRLDDGTRIREPLRCPGPGRCRGRRAADEWH